MNPKQLCIPGTKICYKNKTILTSIGSSTLDFFIGGGLAVGTINIIEEDQYNSYSSLLLKYFLAEGVAREHSLYLASGDKGSGDLIKELPASITSEISADSSKPEKNVDDQLKIAWRYKESSLKDTARGEFHNIGFDLTKNMPEEMLKRCLISVWDPSNTDSVSAQQSGNFLEVPYSDLYDDIRRELNSQKLRTSMKQADNIMRIGISSISSPIWRNNNDELDNLNLVRFLYALKALLRSSFAVAVITVPAFLLSNKVLISRMRQICDTVIGMDSFVGAEQQTNPAFKEYDGLLYIRKLPVLNTWVYPDRTEDLAFKLKKKGLLIERYHLPPAFDDPVGELQSLGCSGAGKKLDF